MCGHVYSDIRLKFQVDHLRTACPWPLSTALHIYGHRPFLSSILAIHDQSHRDNCCIRLMHILRLSKKSVESMQQMPSLKPRDGQRLMTVVGINQTDVIIEQKSRNGSTKLPRESHVLRVPFPRPRPLSPSNNPNIKCPCGVPMLQSRRISHWNQGWRKPRRRRFPSAVKSSWSTWVAIRVAIRVTNIFSIGGQTRKDGYDAVKDITLLDCLFQGLKPNLQGYVTIANCCYAWNDGLRTLRTIHVVRISVSSYGMIDEHPDCFSGFCNSADNGYCGSYCCTIYLNSRKRTHRFGVGKRSLVSLSGTHPFFQKRAC